MNTSEQLAALDAWLAARPVPVVSRVLSAASFEDEETLRRSRRQMIASPSVFRRRADHPSEPWMDEVAVAAGEFRGAS